MIREIKIENHKSIQELKLNYVLELGQNSYQETGQELLNDDDEVSRAFLGDDHHN